MTDHKAEWVRDVVRCLEDVAEQMRATGHGDERFMRLIQRAPAATAASEGEDGAVAWIVPSARVTSDGSYEDGPESLVFESEATDYIRRIGAPLYARPAAQVAAPAIPPAAVKVSSEALLFGAGLATASDWAIPRGHGVTRIVDERMAYGWNQCREAMLELAAESAAQVAATPKHDEGREDRMLPDALVPHADEWYRLCERRFYASRIGISGPLAEAIVEALATQPAARRVTDDPRVAELIAAAEGAEALIGVMFGSVHGRYPETIDTPLGIPVKVGKIAASLRAALESFAQPAEGVSGG